MPVLYCGTAAGSLVIAGSELCWALPLVDIEEEGQGNDRLYLVIADIITTHNHIIGTIYSMIQAEQLPLSRLFPEKPAKISVAEVTSSSAIISNISEYVFRFFERSTICHPCNIIYALQEA